MRERALNNLNAQMLSVKPNEYYFKKIKESGILEKYKTNMKVIHDEVIFELPAGTDQGSFHNELMLLTLEGDQHECT